MSTETKALNFLEHIIEEDLANGLSKDKLRFRFPPEPNGYLHIGHTKAIGISFGLGEKYNAPVNLRFDDTNPAKEEQEYVDAIKEDVSWLGYKWAEELYSSDYFQELYDWAFFDKFCSADPLLPAEVLWKNPINHDLKHDWRDLENPEKFKELFELMNQRLIETEALYPFKGGKEIIPSL